MAENTTPTAPEAEEDDSEKIVGECEACGKNLRVCDEIMQDDNNWYIWCVDQTCEEEIAWRLYGETCGNMSEQDKKWSV